MARLMSLIIYWVVHFWNYVLVHGGLKVQLLNLTIPFLFILWFICNYLA
jgi:hypothetical protein